MLAFFGLPRKRSDWTSAAFKDHWLRRHGPLVAGEVEVSRHMRGYVQYHALEGWPSHGWEGVAQLGFDSMQSVAQAFSEPRYLGVIRPDETSFSALDEARFLVTRQGARVTCGGADGTKILFRFLHRRSGVSADAFRAGLKQVAGSFAAASSSQNAFHSYAQYIEDEATADPMNTGASNDFDYHAVETFRMADPHNWPSFRDGAGAASFDTVYAAISVPEASIDMMTQEHVIIPVPDPAGGAPASISRRSEWLG